MLTDKQALRLAKKYINKEPIPSSLKKEFKKSGRAHLQQILPSIAFYEALLKEEGSQEKALALYEKWCFLKIEKMAKLIPVVMKFPRPWEQVAIVAISVYGKE